jgi:hypothetical protein
MWIESDCLVEEPDCLVEVLARLDVVVFVEPVHGAEVTKEAGLDTQLRPAGLLALEQATLRQVREPPRYQRIRSSNRRQSTAARSYQVPMGGFVRIAHGVLSFVPRFGSARS